MFPIEGVVDSSGRISPYLASGIKSVSRSAFLISRCIWSIFLHSWIAISRWRFLYAWIPQQGTIVHLVPASLIDECKKVMEPEYYELYDEAKRSDWGDGWWAEKDKELKQLTVRLLAPVHPRKASRTRAPPSKTRWRLSSRCWARWSSDISSWRGRCVSGAWVRRSCRSLRTSERVWRGRRPPWSRIIAARSPSARRTSGCTTWCGDDMKAAGTHCVRKNMLGTARSHVDGAGEGQYGGSGGCTCACWNEVQIIRENGRELFEARYLKDIVNARFNSSSVPTLQNRFIPSVPKIY